MVGYAVVLHNALGTCNSLSIPKKCFLTAINVTKEGSQALHQWRFCRS